MSSGKPISATPAANALGRYLDVLDRASGGLGDLVHRFSEREESGPGDFVHLARVAVFSQRCDGDIGDVVRVDERLSDVTGWERDLAGQNHVKELSFGEVLAEPAGANHGPLDARTLDDLLAQLRLFLPATRQENLPPHSPLHGSLDEVADGVRRTGDGKVGGVADVRSSNSLERGVPGALVVPIEGGIAAPRRDAGRHATGRESLHYPTAGLAGPTENECESFGLCCVVRVVRPPPPCDYGVPVAYRLRGTRASQVNWLTGSGGTSMT